MLLIVASVHSALMSVVNPPWPLPVCVFPCVPESSNEGGRKRACLFFCSFEKYDAFILGTRSSFFLSQTRSPPILSPSVVTILPQLPPSLTLSVKVYDIRGITFPVHIVSHHHRSLVLLYPFILHPSRLPRKEIPRSFICSPTLPLRTYYYIRTYIHIHASMLLSSYPLDLVIVLVCFLGAKIPRPDPIFTYTRT